MIEIFVHCALIDGSAFRSVGTFEFETDAPDGSCLVRLGERACLISLLDGHIDSAAPLPLLLARAIALSSTSGKAGALTVSDVARVTVQIHVCGIFYALLLAKGDGKQVFAAHGAYVEGAKTRFQIWRLVRQMLERLKDSPPRHSNELSVYRSGDIEYCLVSELPEELHRAFSICHAWSPQPNVPGSSDACLAEVMEQFLGMLRDGHGYIPPTLRRR